MKRLNRGPDRLGGGDGRARHRFSRRQGRRTARNLRDVDVNVDLAPVLDVGRPGGVIAETHRSFGVDRAAVKETAVPFAHALQAQAVAATAKHFPGLGAAAENTDFAVQRIRLSKRTLRSGSTRRPMRRFIAIGGDMVMISSAIYPAFSGKPGRRCRGRSPSASCAAASASTASRSPMRWAAPRSARSAARAGPRSPQRRQGPTCCCSATTTTAPAPTAPCCAS